MKRSDFIDDLHGGWAVYRYYLGHALTLYKHIHSPFRAGSNSGSFNLYPHRTKVGQIYWVDHRDGTFGDCIDFVRILYNLPDARQAVERIQQEVLMGMSVRDASYLYTPCRQDSRTREPVVITCQKRDWLKEDVSFWKRFGVSTELLDTYHVAGCEWVRFRRDTKEYTWRHMPVDQLYLISFPSGRMKVYRPNTTNRYHKWRSNTTVEDVFGYAQLKPSAHAYVLMAGNKDVLSFSATIGQGVAFSLMSENILLSPYLYAQLRKQCEKLYILYDADTTGEKYIHRTLTLYPDMIPIHSPVEQIHKIAPNVKDYAAVVDFLQQKNRPDKLQELITYYKTLLLV